jgi:hypothetical protein
VPYHRLHASQARLRESVYGSGASTS